jgi:tetratricopeptide (TPR) repeat protein
MNSIRLYTLAEAYVEAGNLDDAVADYREAIKLDADFSAAWYGLGLAYGKEGKGSEVLDALDHLRKLDPSLADKLAKILSNK